MRNRLTPQPWEDAAPAEIAEDLRKEPRADPEPDARRAVVRSRASGVFHGTIADVSFSGLALALDDASGLTAGEPVELLYRNDRIAAVVKYVLAGEDHYRVGFEVNAPRCHEGE